MKHLATLFMVGTCAAASALAITALFTPSWVVTSFAGSKQLGLIWSCREPLFMPKWCGIMHTAPTVWSITALLIMCGSVLLVLAAGFLLIAELRKKLFFLNIMRGLAAAGVMSLCLGSLMFPIGFSLEEIGGTPYKLPHVMKVGSSFSLFMGAVFFAILTNVVAGKSFGQRERFR